MTSKRIKFDASKFPTLVGNNWTKFCKKFLLTAKLYHCEDIFDLSTEDPALTLQGKKLKAYLARRYQMYCVLFDSVGETAIGEELIDEYSEDYDARAVFAGLKEFHEECGVQKYT